MYVMLVHSRQRGHRSQVDIDLSRNAVLSVENTYHFGELNRWNITSLTELVIDYGNPVTSILSAEDICQKNGFMGILSDIRAHDVCIRDVLGNWSEVLVMKMICNVLVLLVSTLSLKSKAIAEHGWMRLSPRLDMDKEYAAVLSHLELTIIFGMVTPVILPIVGLVIMLTMWFYRTSVRNGRHLRRSKHLHFPILYLFYPVLLQNGLILSFFYINDLSGFDVMALSFACCDAMFLLAVLCVKYDLLRRCKR